MVSLRSNVKDYSVSNHAFIQNYIVPSFLGSVKEKILFSVYDLDGRIVIASDMFCRYFGFENYTQLIGLTPIKEKLFKQSHIMENPNDLKPYEEMLNEWERIRQKVISTEKLVAYMNIAPFPQGTAVFEASHFPLWDAEGKVVATQAINRRLGNYNPLNRYSQLYPDASTKDLQKNDSLTYFNLTEEEYEIIFLVHLGATQEEISEIMNISRSKIAKLISYKICAKLKIEDKSIKSLIEFIDKYKLVNVIPNHLVDPLVIMIDSIDYDLPVFR